MQNMGTGILCREADTSVPVPMCVVLWLRYHPAFLTENLLPDHF